jgi:hypothetical protein
MMQRLRAFAFPFVLAALLVAGDARSQESRSFAVVYDVYTGGLQVVELGIDLSMAASRYELLTRVKTRGMYATMFPWEQVSRASGQVDANKIAPLRYEQRGTFRGKPRSVEIGYRDGRVSEIKIEPPPADDNDREPVGLDALLGSVDPLSGIMGVLMQVDRGGTCTGRYDGFDGRRRFTIEFTDRGIERVEAGKPLAFNGDARGCDFVYRQTGGFMRRVTWGPDRQREPQIGRAWLAEAISRAPIVPVRIEIDNNWGRTIAHLRKPAP